MSVIRYKMVARMKQPDGDFVTYEDYARLEAEKERLEGENRAQYESATEWKRLYEKAVNETTDDLIGEVESLRAEVERLRELTTPPT